MLQGKSNNERSGKNIGFTLIELLFVVAILGVIASLSMVFLQKRATEAKIERSALQMQQLFEAGMAYYNDNGKWPDATNTPPFDLYIPVGSKDTPWGGEYRYTPITTSGSTSKFRVCTPSLPNNIANRLKNLLPSGAVYKTTSDACDSNSMALPVPCEPGDAECQVVSDVISGSGMGGQLNLVKLGHVTFVKDKSLCPAGEYCSLFDSTGHGSANSDSANNPLEVRCPAGWDTVMIATPYQIDAQPLGGSTLGQPIRRLDIITNCVSPDPTNKISCTIDGYFQRATDQEQGVSILGEKLAVYYFGYCQKNQ